MLDKAIKKINSNAQFKYENDDINTIVWLNGTTPISKEDIEKQLPIVQKEEADKITKTTNDRASGKAKLKAGEALTDDEISALFGD
jgi:hypothetical protein